MGFDTLRDQERFEREGELAEGIVLTKSITRDRDSGNGETTTYRIGFRFSAPDGTVVSREAVVSGDLWDRMVEREPVRVTFLPSDPQTNRIEGEGSTWILALIFAGLGLVFAPIGGFIFFKGVAGILLTMRLARAGTAAKAVVLDVGPTRISFRGVPQWQIRYRYVDGAGRSHVGVSAVRAPEEAQAWQKGDAATVLYDARAPEKSVWAGEA